MIEAATIAAKEYAADMDGVEEVSLRMSRINAFIYGARFQSTRDTSPAPGVACKVCGDILYESVHDPAHPDYDHDFEVTSPAHGPKECPICWCGRAHCRIHPAEESPAPATVTDESPLKELAERTKRGTFSEEWEQGVTSAARVAGCVNSDWTQQYMWFRLGAGWKTLAVGPALARLAELEKMEQRLKACRGHIVAGSDDTYAYILTGSDAEKGKT